MAAPIPTITAINQSPSITRLVQAAATLPAPAAPSIIISFEDNEGNVVAPAPDQVMVPAPTSSPTPSLLGHNSNSLFGSNIAISNMSTPDADGMVDISLDDENPTPG
jgi:hypothetical protein